MSKLQLQTDWSYRLAITGLGIWILVAAYAQLDSTEVMAIDRRCMGGCPPGAAHWLGTDSLGRDVLLQLIHGARTALLGGLAAAGLSLLFGYCIGTSAAWMSRGKRQLPWLWLALVAIAVGLTGYWMVYPPQGSVFFMLLLVGFVVGTKRLFKLLPVPLQAGIRADQVLLFVAEIVSSVPAILLLLSLAALAFRPGLGQLVLLFVSVRWTNFAVLSLQETRAILVEPYVKAAHFSGASSVELLSQHVLPNAIKPILVQAILSVSGFILVEGAFSFLGLGLPVSQASWGRVLAQAQEINNGWWLWILPSIAICGSILCLQLLSRKWQKSQATRYKAQF